MKNLTVTICLTIAVILGSMRMSANIVVVGDNESVNFQKGLTAAEKGNFATAIREWEPLAKKGNAVAKYNLGVMYCTGEGVIQDNVHTHMWWNIDASSGDEGAVKKRDTIV